MLTWRGNPFPRKQALRFMLSSATWSKLDDRSIVEDIFGKSEEKLSQEDQIYKETSLKLSEFVAS